MGFSGLKSTRQSCVCSSPSRKEKMGSCWRSQRFHRSRRSSLMDASTPGCWCDHAASTTALVLGCSVKGCSRFSLCHKQSFQSLEQLSISVSLNGEYASWKTGPMCGLYVWRKESEYDEEQKCTVPSSVPTK